MTRRAKIAIGLGTLSLIVAGSALALYAYFTTPHFVRHSQPIYAYGLLEDPKQIVLRVHTGSWDVVEEPTVDQFRERIAIRAWVSEYVPGIGRFKNAALYEHRITITLREPLSDRIVIDYTTGKPVPKTQ